MSEKKENKRRTFRKKEPFIKWSAVLKLEDIVPKRGRHDTRYAVLYIDGGGSCVSSLEIAERLALYEFYEFSGKVRQTKGGTFLSVSKVVDARSYKDFTEEVSNSSELIPF